MKHRKGYFKGNFQSYLLNAYISYRKSTELLSNIDMATELGISVRSLYYYKKGVGKRGKNFNAVIKKIDSEIKFKNGGYKKEGIIILEIVNKLRKKYSNIKDVKELSIEEINKLKEREKEKIKAESINDEADYWLVTYGGIV